MKRLMDVVVSMLAVIILSPLLLIMGLAVALSSPGGAFFRQVRVGKGGREFRLLKFRSMKPGSEAKGQLTVGGRDPRITKVGHVLRRTKMDELPQLFNILAGDMSLVGPRPEVPKYVSLYTPEQRHVLNVRPGLTDYASLEYFEENKLLGASDDPERTYIEEVMPAKLALNLKYIQEMGMKTDLLILLRTARRIVRG
jgi:lipopolysaccharide/colanic/teichoic acid biosynthesis glycosyltransferase